MNNGRPNIPLRFMADDPIFRFAPWRVCYANVSVAPTKESLLRKRLEPPVARNTGEIKKRKVYKRKAPSERELATVRLTEGEYGRMRFSSVPTPAGSFRHGSRRATSLPEGG